jgi:pimeloyl-ACP methyl ester carboxylesterase
MLALAYAARHPTRVSAVVIVGCGTFDETARATMNSTIAGRMTDELRAQFDRLDHLGLSPAERHWAQHLVMRPTEVFADLGVDNDDIVDEPFDLRAWDETWTDMVRLQKRGDYPREFIRITCPVLMLHGTYDPHPGDAIRDSLRGVIPHLEYRAWDRCGHEPWSERYVRDEFLNVLRGWLSLGNTASDF